MTNECRMTPEQWQALLGVIDTVGNDWAVDARAKARRLLVEPEQIDEAGDWAFPKQPGASIAAAIAAAVASGIGFYSISTNEEGALETKHIPRDDVLPDPDLTTFGELEAGECMRLVNSHPKAALIKVACPNGSWNAVGFEEGESYSLLSSEPVRRLPKPEWSK